MKIYGLTGKTGSGKTTVAKMLSEKGFYIVDGDVLARKVTEKGSEVLKELSDCFGEDIISEDGTLKRHELARRAFSSENDFITNSADIPSSISMVVYASAFVLSFPASTSSDAAFTGKPS